MAKSIRGMHVITASRDFMMMCHICRTREATHTVGLCHQDWGESMISEDEKQEIEHGNKVRLDLTPEELEAIRLALKHDLFGKKQNTSSSWHTALEKVNEAMNSDYEV